MLTLIIVGQLFQPRNLFSLFQFILSIPACPSYMKHIFLNYEGLAGLPKKWFAVTRLFLALAIPSQKDAEGTRM
jgi:hypothetical protein